LSLAIKSLICARSLLAGRVQRAVAISSSML
jgi:hypothetical protein